MDTALSPGIATVIDDGIEKEKDINTIINRIDERGIPICKITSLDSAEKFLPNLVGSNFVILDWNMFEKSEGFEEGVTPSATLREQVHNKVISFIKKLKEVCFAPVFLFTQEAAEDINDQIIPMLEREGLYSKKGRNFIYIRNKKELLQADRLFVDINKWIEDNPPIYVLELWQTEMLKAKNKVFWSLYNKSEGWPWILWSSFAKEGEDPRSGIDQTLFKLISSTTGIPKLDEKRLKIATEIDVQELKNIIRATMYLEKDHLRGVKPGDIFEIGREYYLNVRPECDTIESRTDGMVYLIKGKKKHGSELKKEDRYSETVGFIEHVDEAFVQLLEEDENDVVVFSLKNLFIKTFKDIERYRRWRLLPPYITRIQQRFAHCIGRVGILRLPKELEEETLRMPSNEE